MKWHTLAHDGRGDSMLTADIAWLYAINDAMHGEEVSPRGQKTYEQLHVTHKIDMLYPLVTIKERKLNYCFAAAEALWILRGSNFLSDILPYNSKMAEFSDDGVTLAGAYGPRIINQWSYVASKLVEDPDSRQAAITIWQPNPQPSKDIPCTMSMCFKIRDDKLHLSVFMRSSDVWLGLPYDIFAFSMVAYLMVVELRSAYPKLAPGCLWITAASSHLYARDYYLAKEIPAPQEVPRPAPEALWCSNARYFLGYLDVLRGSKPGDTHRWWSK